ncbi:(DL)-glycerol-3-phosphatase 2-like isoform X1 [Phoenix dactylifera]|uniref:(DL)-glycerol-3-phosphatase 2-like isoform X1 n=1 Tax=Phoenix dactylifera TaxID=42345 RepID=A0A8B8J4E4_PHODC|nr:(DL)-glycerol-3-phosphatase 2-like isoform X1 [Phoenix dactylifera]
MAMASPSSAGLEGETERVSPPKGAITHVIFDFDGTLIDTQPFYTLVQERILSRFGKPYDPSIEAKLMGKKPTESARIFVEETGLAGLLTPEGFLEERNAMLTELFPSSQLLPGEFSKLPILGLLFLFLIPLYLHFGCLNGTLALITGVKRLVSHLHANGIPMCVATGTYKHNFEVLTQNHGETFAMMHHVVLGDDPEVKKRKPAPDVFLIALKRFEVLLTNVVVSSLLTRYFLSMVFSSIKSFLSCNKSLDIFVDQGNVDPSEVLVFEDAPSGVAAAKNAGMSAVMLSDAGPDASAYKQADQVLSSLLDFKPSHWGLPPFKDTVI